MSSLNTLFISMGILATLTLQSCASTPQTANSVTKQVAVERWNRCLQRFPAKAEQLCDGHRRDVLAAYPAYMEGQIQAHLSQQVHHSRARQLLSTGLGIASNELDRNTLHNFIAIGAEARGSDL